MQGVARGGAMVIVADIKGDAATHVADRIAQNGAHARAAQIDVSNREPVQPTMKRTPACSIISSACLAASLGLKPSLTTQKTGRPFTPPLPFTSWSAELAPSNKSAPSFPSGPLKGNIAPSLANRRIGSSRLECLRGREGQLRQWCKALRKTAPYLSVRQHGAN